MIKTAFIFVPGVLSYPGSAKNWTDRAVTWIHQQQTCDCAEKFEYLALPATRNVLAAKRAAELAKLIDRYPASAFKLVIAAHSFGCELARLALLSSSRGADAVHLFTPAINAEPRRHRLKGLLSSGKIQRLHIHLSKRDKVLTASFLGGMSEPDLKKQFDGTTAVISTRHGGHSAWWAADRFDESMHEIFGGGTPDHALGSVPPPAPPPKDVQE